MLGIAAKSGNVASGEFSTEKAVKEGKAWLVIVAEDASDNTKKMFSNMTEFYEVPMYTYADKETLGHFIGKEFRASLAVTNEGLARSIEEKLKQTITTE
jgi:ribosomal protein L7Ae-like RNA K-turn-binding protein